VLDSAFGGVKAIVLIPAGLVETPTTSADDPVPHGRPGRHEQVPIAPARLTPGAVPRRAGGDGADSLGQRMSPATTGTGPDQPGQPAAAAMPWETAAALPSGPGGGHAPLARRERLANLSPGLRTDTTATPEYLVPRRPRRSPDEVRGAMSAFQRGSRLGRDSASEDKR
jgi:hypothetical protein